MEAQIVQMAAWAVRGSEEMPRRVERIQGQAAASSQVG